MRSGCLPAALRRAGVPHISLKLSLRRALTCSLLHTMRGMLTAAPAPADQDVSDQLPRVLNDEIQRMCQELGNDRLAMTAPWDRSGGAVGSSHMWVGCHVSTAGGMERAVLHAAAIGEMSTK